MGGPLAPLHCGGHGRDPFVPSAVLDGSFAAGQGGRLPVSSEGGRGDGALLTWAAGSG